MNATRLLFAIAHVCGHVSIGRTQEVSSGVSPENVAIDAAFKGATLTVFGAVRGASDDAGLEGADVVVIVRGPGRLLEVRPKRRVAGLWVNGPPRRISGAPGFVHMAANKDFDALASPAVRAQWSIGLDHLDFSLPEAQGEAGERTAVEHAVIADRMAKGLYQEAQGAVFIVDETFFTVAVPLPASAPVGFYDVDTLLLRDGAVVDTHLRRFQVRRAGVERVLYGFAQNWPTLYGVTALVLALGAGWAASAVFRRR